MSSKKLKAGQLKVFLPYLLLFGPALLLILIGTRGCNHVFKELDDYGQQIEYTFKDINGKVHSSSEFKDQIVVITTIQPTCPDSCGVSLWHLNQGLYQHIRKNKTKQFKQIKIVSFVTDGAGNPSDDLLTPTQWLKNNVEGFDPELWMVASGDARKLYQFEHNGQRLENTGKEYFGGHSYQELMLLLDKQNHLRMVLSGKSEGMIRRMKQCVALLQKQYDKARAQDKK
ncbi:MAG: hypothetical protein V4638_09200 [Bacteroidota bacterium]